MTHAPDEIIAKLGELEPDEIAKLFRNLGIVGWTRQAGSCPVANYVQRETGRSAVIDPRRWHARKVNGRPLHQWDNGELPATVAQFVKRFDALGYPELIGD
jgi:hypothetical protein